MRFYLVILSDIEDQTNDRKFFNYVIQSKYEFWRYTAFNWIIGTPETVSTNEILTNVIESYGAKGMAIVLEITINDVAGLVPEIQGDKELGAKILGWFKKVKSAEFVPTWEK